MPFRFHLSTLFIWLCGIAGFAFISYKAWHASFTIDESYTYLHYVNDSFIDLISYAQFYTNNHPLNSLFMKYAEMLFGTSEFTLRLPNLILFLVYMWYCYALFRDTDRWLALAVFVLLCVNPVLVDFFGLARGYGLSFGFMVACFYHFLTSLKTKHRKHIYLFHATAVLAILSNFTMLNVYVSLLLIGLFLMLVDRLFLTKQKNVFSPVYKNHLVAFVLALIFLYVPVRRLIQHNMLDFGGKDGFYDNTVMSLIGTSFHNTHIAAGLLLFFQVLVTGIVVAFFALLVWKIRQRDFAFFENHLGLIVSNLLLISLAVMIVMQHVLLGTDYLVARFSVFLYPLLIIHIAYVFRYIFHLGFEKMSLAIVFVLATLAVVSFSRKANLYACSEWEFDQETKNMLQQLKNHKPQSGKLKLGVHWIFEPTINFYKKINLLTWLDTVDREKPKLEDDFYYVFETDSLPLERGQAELVLRFEKTNTLLIRNKRPPTNVLELSR